MRMEVGDERALNTWIQRTAGTQDAVEQTMRRFLYRLSRSGVLDLQDDLPDEKHLEKPQDATVGGVYNSVPPERSQPPAGGIPAGGVPAAVQPPVMGVPAKNVPTGWDAPIPPPSFSPAAPSTSAEPMSFPPSRPPAWLSQGLAGGNPADAGLATGEQEMGSPHGVAPLLPVVEVPTAAKLEDSGDTGRDGRMRVPTGAGVS